MINDAAEGRRLLNEYIVDYLVWELTMRDNDDGRQNISIVSGQAVLAIASSSRRGSCLCI
jgi:hypothetical protein